MVAQDAALEQRRTTPVELFWDLVFVFAITQVSTLLAGDLSWAGLGRAMLVLALVWWAWSAFVWMTNAHDPDAPHVRAALFGAMILTFLVALAVPGAWGDEATLFAVAYACVRFVHLALYVDAARRGNASLSAIAGFSVTVAIGMALLIAGSLAGEPIRAVLWVAAAAIDYAGPAWLTRERLAALQRVAVAHFAERYSLFIIICLGESVVAVGLGAEGLAVDGELAAGVVVALLVTVGLWGTYFHPVAPPDEERLAPPGQRRPAACRPGRRRGSWRRCSACSWPASTPSRHRARPSGVQRVDLRRVLLGDRAALELHRRGQLVAAPVARSGGCCRSMAAAHPAPK